MVQKHDQFCDLAKFLCIFFVRTAPPAPARALPPPRPARPAGNRPAHPRTCNPRCQWHWPCGPGRAARAPLQHALQLSLHATSPSQAAAPAPPRSPARGPPPRPRHPNLAAGLASRLSGQQSHFRCTRPAPPAPRPACPPARPRPRFPRPPANYPPPPAPLLCVLLAATPLV